MKANAGYARLPFSAREEKSSLLLNVLSLGLSAVIATIARRIRLVKRISNLWQV